MIAIALLVACAPPEESWSPEDLLQPDRAAEPAPPPASADGVRVVINELQASNKSTWQDTETWDFPDWVELYNAGTASVALADLLVSDESGSSWRGPDDVYLGPGETLFLPAFGLDHDFNLPFNLSSAGGDSVILSYRGAVVDVVPVGELPDDLSMARFPDGGDWQPTARPTPGTTNGSAPSASLDPTTEFFQPFVMHEVDIRVSPSEFTSLNSGNPAPCSVTIDGIYFPKSALKNTGQGSYDPMSGKPRLVVNLDAYDTGRVFRGIDNLELHNGKTIDTTRGHDWISYKYVGMGGAPASRVGFTHVTLAGENYGLYVMIENQDDKFIEARFPASKETGMMFEGGDIGNNAINNMEYETGPVPANARSVAALEAADTIASGPSTDENIARLWDYVDKDELLNYMAFEGIADNWDGYQSPHNYRWYVDGVTHRIEIVPAGIEITWADAYGNPGDPELWASNGHLAVWCIANAGCKKDYAEHVIAMANLVDDEDFLGQYVELTDWLLPYIKADPKKFVTIGTVESDIAVAKQKLRDNPQMSRNQIYALYPDLKP
jgi:hypothetical protein